MRYFKGWESWYFFHLERRAKTFGLGEDIINIFDKIGWKIAKGEDITQEEYNQGVKALTRIASIRNFEKTCDNPVCPVCHKVVNEYFSGEVIDEPWKLSVELYGWQKEAKKIWKNNNGHGIVKVVTGAGKTIFALSIISDLFNSFSYIDGGLRVIIVVPTTVLLDQWYAELTDKLHISIDEIGLFYGKKKKLLKNKKIIIYVVNSARIHLREHYERFFKGNDLFLIADECHTYGSKENSKIFSLNYSYTLGLSATPERYGDFGFEEKLVPNLGPIIYSYTYTDALRDGIIPPYKLIRIRVKLTETELAAYDEISAKIKSLALKLKNDYPILASSSFLSEFIKKLNYIYEKTNDERITIFEGLLNKRKSLIHMSESKLSALKWLYKEENLKDDKLLIFHERIEVAEEIYRYLVENNMRVGIYHSEMGIRERMDSISAFRDGRISILVSCRALDEGFDVPSADTGVIVAGTSSVRQWIQRMGRILRKSPNKEFSKIYVIFTDEVEHDVFTGDDLREFESEALSVEEIDLRYSNKLHP